MIQMQRSRNRAVLAVFAHGVADALCADALGFHRAVHEVEFAAHERRWMLPFPANRAGMQQFNGCECLSICPTLFMLNAFPTIAVVLIRRFQNCSHRYKPYLSPHAFPGCFMNNLRQF